MYDIQIYSRVPHTVNHKTWSPPLTDTATRGRLTAVGFACLYSICSGKQRVFLLNHSPMNSMAPIPPPLCRALQCVRALLHDRTKALSSFLYLLAHELQLYETIWQAIKKITKYEIQVSIRSISMSGFIKRNTKNKFVISNCKKAFFVLEKVLLAFNFSSVARTHRSLPL